MLNGSESKAIGQGLQAALGRMGVIVAVTCGGTAGGGGSRAAVVEPIIARLLIQLNKTLEELEIALLDAAKTEEVKKRPLKKTKKPE